MSDLFNTGAARRHEIDWLRSLAFILLIFYHIGMFYVADWDWHVKSEYQSTFLQSIMLLVNPWRMPLIFFLSGFALCLVEVKVSVAQLIKVRFWRILVPLIVGMYTILIPQPFYEAVQNYGYSGTIWEFSLEYINPDTKILPQMNHGPLGLLTWNHLWYLVYLWHYTLVYILVRPLLKKLAKLVDGKVMRPRSWLLLMAITITLIEVILEPVFPRTHALVDDWYNHARYFLLFSAGYIVAKSANLYKKIVQHCWYWVAAAIPLYFFSLLIHQTQIVQIESLAAKMLATFFLVIGALCWLFSALAMAGTYLTRSNKFLVYINEAILPWYILHQTIIIVLAMFLASFRLGGLFEPSLLLLGTVALCAISYEFIKRWKLTRFLFGMKQINHEKMS